MDTHSIKLSQILKFVSDSIHSQTNYGEMSDMADTDTRVAVKALLFFKMSS